jgi:hypothetical protein
MTNNKTGSNEFEAIQLGVGSFFCEEVVLHNLPSIYQVQVKSNNARFLSLSF